MFRRFFLSAICLALPTGAFAVPVKSQPVDVVICLDTSNSMDGLIDSAKQKLWDVVNNLAQAQPVPDLRVSLYHYGNNTLDSKTGWVSRETDLTRDLDEVSKKLFGLTTNGGTEYVARVSRDALNDVKWSTEANSLRIIFVCGNEGVDQDPDVKLADVTKAAKAKGVIINTIYCGPAGDSIAPGWFSFAESTGGQGLNIDQNQIRREVQVKSPFDQKILELNQKLNTTYIAYGRARDREAAGEKLRAQDANAASAAPNAIQSRIQTKAGALYRNSQWDLVDRLEEEKTFDLSTLKDEELPDELRKLKPEERLAYVKKKAEERAEMRQQIRELGEKRNEFVKEALKKMPESDQEQAFATAINKALREQAATKGIKIPE